MGNTHDAAEPDKLDIDESEEYFGPLYEFVMDDEITDVDFNGTDLWLTNAKNVRYHSDAQIPLDFVEQFTKRVANAVSKPFHKQQPILEAETGRLRITIVHESVAISGRTICIRKSLPYVRMTEEGMLREKYCSREIINLLKSCILAKQNIVFCGEPGAGKTECAKFFSQYIPENERVITIEDNPEWHYKEVNPSKDCVELKVGKQVDYTAAIKTCLRLNPKWMMLSESRSTEILKLLEGFSTGVKGLTTLHADDVRNVPDRMVNMSGQARNEGRMENDIYSFIDLAVLIRRKEVTEEDGSTHVRRFIDQLCFFERDGQENLCHMIVEDGVILSRKLPKGLLKKLQYAGLPDPMLQTEEEPPGSRETVEIRSPAPVASAGSEIRLPSPASLAGSEIRLPSPGASAAEEETLISPEVSADRVLKPLDTYDYPIKNANRKLTLVAEAPSDSLVSFIPPAKKGGTYLGWAPMQMGCSTSGG